MGRVDQIMRRIVPVFLVGLLVGTAEMAGNVLDSASLRDSGSVAADSSRPRRGVVQGVVTDAEGQGIPGATVVVNGTSRGAAADVDGNFRISGVLSGTYTLTASSIGYQNQTIESIVVQGGDSVEVRIVLNPSHENEGVLGCPFVDPRTNPVDPYTTGTIHIITREELLY